MKLTPTAEKLIKLMQPEVDYTTSSLGYLVFGDYHKELKRRRSPQGSALAVGKFYRELMSNQLITRAYGSYYLIKLTTKGIKHRETLI